jgi:hypothetical protein
MPIMGDDPLGICGDCTVDELIVVQISLDDLKSKIRLLAD